MLPRASLLPSVRVASYRGRVTTVQARVPDGFRRVLDSIRQAPLPPALRVREVPAPRGIAPLAVSVEAALEPGVGPERTLGADAEGDGILTVLFDPAEPAEWGAAVRLVTRLAAPVPAEMADDPLLAPVAWGWLHDAVIAAGASRLGGTVSVVANHRFGTLAGAAGEDRNIEIRGSWSSPSPEISGHVLAWATALCALAGRPVPPSQEASAA